MNEKEKKRAREPVAFVTKSRRVVSKRQLEDFAVKQESKQIEDAFEDIYDEQGLVQPLYNMDVLAALLEMNPYHYRASKTKARDTSGLGWHLRPNEQQLNEREPEEEQFNQGLQFFKAQWPPVGEILERIMVDFEGTGNGYMELVRADDEPEEAYALMEHVPSHTIRMHKSRNKFMQRRGGKTVWFKRVGHEADVDLNNGLEYGLGELPPEKRASEIVHCMNYTSRSDYYGVPDIIPSLGAVIGHLSQRDYNIAFFDNFGIPSYAVYITGDYDLGAVDEQTGEYEVVQHIREKLDEVAEEPHSSLVFGIPGVEENSRVHVEFVPLAVNVEDASFRMYRKDNRDEVLSVHGVPPYRAGIAEEGSLGGSTAAESTEIYKTSVLAPRQEMLERNINKYILWDNLELCDWRFELERLDTADEKHDMELLTGLFERGAASPNDLIRNLGRRFGIEPVDHPAMDAYYLGGQPITNEDVLAEQDVETALMSLQRRLIEIAAKREAEAQGRVRTGSNGETG